MKRLVVLVVGLVLVVAGCTKAAPAAAPPAGAPSSVDPSPSPPTAAELMKLALVPLDPDPSWTPAFDADTKSNDLKACGSHPLNSPSDAARTVGHLKEWRNGDAGAGEYVYVLPGGTAADLVALHNQTEAACPSQPLPPGGVSTKLPVGNVDLPEGAEKAVLFCEKATPKGHPVSYNCYTALSAGRVFVSVFGYGSSQAAARDFLLVMLDSAAQQLQMLPG